MSYRIWTDEEIEEDMERRGQRDLESYLEGQMIERVASQQYEEWLAEQLAEYNASYMGA